MGERMKLDDMLRVGRILRKYDYIGVKTSLSYISRLFPHLGAKAPVILLCGVPLNNFIEDETQCEEKSSALNVTGSPLSHSFDDDNFNESLNLAKRNWCKNEERHQPIPMKSAIMMLNLLHEEVGCDENWKTPLFALCDRETKNCVLIGSFFDKSVFVTFRVTILPMKSLTNIKNEVEELLTQHSKESSTVKDDIDIKIMSIYELGGSCNEMTDWREQLRNEFRGHIKIEANWSGLGFLPPPRGLCNNITAEIMSGSRVSLLYDLWCQIILLYKYLSILEEYRLKHSSSRYSVMPLNFSKDFSTPYQQDESVITYKLNRLLIGDDTFDDENYIINKAAVSNSDTYEIKLVDIVKELSKRENLDFTDRFWRIIRSTVNYMQMTDCLHTVFEAISENNYKPQLYDMDDTRFGKIVSNLENEKDEVLRAGSLSLELVIDIGLEKIRRDYVYLLSCMNITDVYDIRKTLFHAATGEFHIENYRNKLMSLAQLHISLEFIQLIQSEFLCHYSTIYTIFEYATKKFCVVDSPLKYGDLINNTIYTLSMPAPKDFMKAVTKMSPSSWMCTLSSARSLDKLTTVYHYSRLPIFPPNIYKPETLDKDNKKEIMYHTTTAMITHLMRPNFMQ